MLRQAMSVLRLFSRDRPELGVVETADLLDRPRSSVSRWLRDMADAGFLVRDPASGRYRLSMELAALGELSRRSTSLQKVARPVLEALVRDTGETSNLVILEGEFGVNVEVVQSPRPVKHVGVLGRRLPLHATAAGKVLLAGRPDEEIAAILAGELPRLTGFTFCDRARLEEIVARVRVEGFATAWRELEEDLAAASAPVRDHTGEVVAAVTTSVPVSRISREALPELARRVRVAADEVSRGLGAPEAGMSPPS